MNDSTNAGSSDSPARIASADVAAGRSGASAAGGRAEGGAAGAMSTRGGGNWPAFVAVIAIVAVVLMAAGGWVLQDRLGSADRELARRLQAADLREAQRDQQQKLLGDTLRETQSKASLLEAKLADSLGQQAQLRQLYDEMARSRGDLMLADVESALMIATQQLQIGGNVQSALLALQNAEQVLARSNQPDVLGLRRVLARDIERLKAVPMADFAAAVDRLDAVLGAVDQMALLADVAGSEALPPASPAGVPREGLMGFPERVARTGLQGWDAFVAELRQLVRVQRVDRPEALLLSPEQRFFARENLRLQLLNARLNLLARNEGLFRGDLARAQRIIERWFDPKHSAVANGQASLRQLQGTPLAVELPAPSESITAVRAARASSDAR
jgi:uroporphyrin-3 C-methyltransferase/uroporphyrinogen III methyltransferase/synthase